MTPTVDIDNYQVRTSTSTGAEYIGFNVFFRFDESHGFQSCDWRLQGGLLFPPYKIVGRGKGFFTHTYVLESTARAIHDQASADLLVAKKSDPSLPFVYLEDGWKSAVAGTANLRRLFPTVYAELPVEAAPKAQGKQRSLKKQGEVDTAPPTTVSPRPIPKPSKFVPEEPSFDFSDFQKRHNQERPYGWYEGITPEEELRKWHLTDATCGNGMEGTRQ